MAVSVSSAPDPFEIGKYYQSIGPVQVYSKVWDKTPVLPSSLSGTTKCIMVIGDSLPANSGPSLYTVTQAKNYNFNIGDGAIYPTSDPVLGASNGVASPYFSSVCAPLGDSLISGGYCTNAVVMPNGMASSTVGDWAAGGPLNKNIGAMYRRFVLTGLTVNAIIWHAGPNDTNAGTSQADYTSRLNSVISTIRSFWASTPILIGTCSKASGSTSSAIQNAQAAVINNPSGIWAGVNSDSYGAGSFQDGTHFNTTGRAAWVSDAITALHSAGAI